MSTDGPTAVLSPLRGFDLPKDPRVFRYTHRFVSDGTWFQRGTDCYPMCHDDGADAVFVGRDAYGKWDGEYCGMSEFSIVPKRSLQHHSGSRILTSSGVYFDPLDPDPDLLLIEDIASALSKVSRFSGHTPVPLSVAQHSVGVYRRTEGLHPSLRMQALLHDAFMLAYEEATSAVSSCDIKMV
jgi:hypothetical protein